MLAHANFSSETHAQAILTIAPVGCDRVAQVQLPEYKSDFQVHQVEREQGIPVKLKEFCPNLEPEGLDLLHKMLQYDPAQRITAKQAMCHEYFNDLPPETRARSEPPR